jgi:peptidoglycan-N-acetylmuramic acid deacetylase
MRFSYTHSTTTVRRPALLALLAGLALLLAWPAAPSQATPAAAQYENEITRVSPGKHQVALTFDGDAFGGRVDEILATLRSHKAGATFFLTAHYLNTFPTRSKAIVAAGQEIASHGYDHRDYRALTDGAIARRLLDWEATFTRLTGKHSPSFWRAPYGYSTNRVRVVAAQTGYHTIYWTLDALDTVGAPKSATFIYNRLTRPSINLDGAILLLHVNPNGTIDALPRVLTALQNKGLAIVTVSRLLAR